MCRLEKTACGLGAEGEDDNERPICDKLAHPSYGADVHTCCRSACLWFFGAVVTLLLTVPAVADRSGFADSRGRTASGTVELLFVDPLIHVAPGNRCEDEICTRLLDLIQGSETSINFAVYGMRNQTQLLKALQTAQGGGTVTEKDGIITHLLICGSTAWATFETTSVLRPSLDQRDTWTPSEPTCSRPAGFQGPLQCLAYDLGDRWLMAAHASRETFDRSDEGRVMHDKFFVVDGRWVWTGSANVSDSGTGGYNANVVAVVDSPWLVDVYTDEFEQMWSGRFHQLKESDGVSVWQ